MPEYLAPGVYVEETAFGPKSIEGVSTSTAAFVGPTTSGPADRASGKFTNLVEFEREYGGVTDLRFSDGTRQVNWLWHSARAFFANGGQQLVVSRVRDEQDAPPNAPAYRAALARLDSIEDISIVAAPGSTAGIAQVPAGDVQARCEALLTHAEMHGRFAIVDCGDQQSVADVLAMRGWFDSPVGALYYPWVTVGDPATGISLQMPPSGFIAGIYARVDLAGGVHKTPANEVVQLATALERNLTASEQDVLNQAGVNCIRRFSGRGIRVWGARTLSSNPEWKYVNVRRFFIYLEQSIERGTQWVVFEPNAEAVWARVRQQVQSFLRMVWRSGALQGATEEQAFFVTCDHTTMTQDDIDNGRLICLVGVAPTRPAEFVIVRILHERT